MKDATLELHAPKLSEAIDRKGGYRDLADQALASARGLVDRVNRLQLAGAEITAAVAEALYLAAVEQRAELPARERDAVRAALQGIEPALVAAVRRVLASGVDP
jgi:hypothetical protein